MQKAIQSLSSLAVHELTADAITDITARNSSLYMPKEDVSRVILAAYFKGHSIEYSPIALRIERDSVVANTEPDTETVLMSEFQEKIVSLMREEADKSFDWWRQVGAALIKDDEIIYVTHNEHMPESQMPNILGDARSLFKKGININYGTAAHAEELAIGRAAKEGIATEGAELYVTDFPCPYCARLIAASGIKTVYFLSGYAVLEGDEYLKGEGVQVVKLTV